MNYETLKNLGLEESEAKVYLALLELGPSGVSEITRQAKITRTLGYHVLEKLGWYGLVDKSVGNGKKIIFSAQHPRALLQHVKNKSHQWERRVSEAQEKLPDLVSLFRTAEKPVVRYQEGAAGIKNIYSETLNSKTKILSILDMDGWNSAEFKNWGENYNRERSRRHIHEHILLLDTSAGRRWMKYYRGSLAYTHYRWIKPEQLPGVLDFGGEINIFENKVVMALHKPHPMGVMIENTALANILKGLFELAWQSVPEKKNK